MNELQAIIKAEDDFRKELKKLEKDGLIKKNPNGSYTPVEKKTNSE